MNPAHCKASSIPHAKKQHASFSKTPLSPIKNGIVPMNNNPVVLPLCRSKW